MIHLFLSLFHIDFYSILIYHFVLNIISICNRHLLLYERADLTASTLLQGIRSRIYSFSYPVPHIYDKLDS